MLAPAKGLHDQHTHQQGLAGQVLDEEGPAPQPPRHVGRVRPGGPPEVRGRVHPLGMGRAQRAEPRCGLPVGLELISMRCCMLLHKINLALDRWIPRVAFARHG